MFMDTYNPIFHYNISHLIHLSFPVGRCHKSAACRVSTLFLPRSSRSAARCNLNRGLTQLSYYKGFYCACREFLMYRLRYRQIVVLTHGRKSRIIVSSCVIVILLVLVMKIYVYKTNDEDYSESEDEFELFSKLNSHEYSVKEEYFLFQCWMSKKCESDEEEVCGMDYSSRSKRLVFAYFENHCAIYMVNCIERTKYTLVEKPLCVAKSQALNEMATQSSRRRRRRTVSSTKSNSTRNTRTTNPSEPFKPVPKIQIIDGKPIRYYI